MASGSAPGGVGVAFQVEFVAPRSPGAGGGVKAAFAARESRAVGSVRAVGSSRRRVLPRGRRVPASFDGPRVEDEPRRSTQTRAASSPSILTWDKDRRPSPGRLTRRVAAGRTRRSGPGSRASARRRWADVTLRGEVVRVELPDPLDQPAVVLVHQVRVFLSRWVAWNEWYRIMVRPSSEWSSLTTWYKYSSCPQERECSGRVRAADVSKWGDVHRSSPTEPFRPRGSFALRDLHRAWIAG